MAMRRYLPRGSFRLSFPTLSKSAETLPTRRGFMTQMNSSRVLPGAVVRHYSIFSNVKEIKIEDLLKREEYLALRKRLEVDPRDHISLPEYFSLCSDYGISESEALSLANSLTDSGIIFFLPSAQDPLLSKTILLKPQRLSEVVRSAFTTAELFTGARSIEEYNSLRDEYERTKALKVKLDRKALKYANLWVVAGGGYLIGQAAILARLTWWEFSWDIMEPITYFITFSTGILGWMYYTVFKSEYTYENLRDSIATRRKHKLYKRNNLNLERYQALEAMFEPKKRSLVL